MDLIYTNNLMEDEGVLSAYELDLAFGSGENDFELRAGAQNILSPGNYIYIEGTEYGGIIDSIEADTATQEIIYHGRTWHGILNSHIIEPPAEQAHRVASGGFHSNLEQILQSLQITDIFEVGDYDQDFNLQTYNIPRYIPGYSGIMKVVEDYNRYSIDQIKLVFYYDYGKIKLKAEPVADYSQAEGEINSDLVEFRIKKVGNKPNVLIGLGQGELENRTVYHLYVKANGTITEDPTEALLGVKRNVAIYENTAEADLEKFKAECYKRLKQLLDQDTIDITLNGSDDCFDIGDTIEATDTLTNTTVRATIKKKIVKIKNGFITVQYDTTDKLAAESRKTYGGGYSGETPPGGAQIDVTALERSFLEKVFHPGVLIIRQNADNPAEYYGFGTWARLKDKYILAGGELYPAGTTGGSATHKHTTADHILTVGQMPKHKHTIGGFPNGTPATWANPYGRVVYQITSDNPYPAINALINQSGNNEPHNHGDTTEESNMGPYEAFYVWIRVA